ncbi:hypothetical protein B0A49_03482 [Cryomyces minteri]|uniref:DUF2423 domain-containing protein n=1 Tax=Cryomyces minteri TaxID=331657 RepID=A0A4U0X717_9PEZI|nr:hypothetical protein B0A49_03482 [Cryomyces minteri]
MAKSSRSSVRKTNNAKLKSRVFGPVEAARTQRLSARLLELASQPKPPRTEMEVGEDSKEQSNTEAAENEPAAEEQGTSHDLFYQILGVCSDIRGFSPEGDLLFDFDPAMWDAMDVDGARGATEDKPSKTALKKRAERTHNRHRKPANNIAFPKYQKGKKGSAGITKKGKR